MGYCNEAPYAADNSPGVSVDQSPSRKVSAACSDVLVQTPSPSDSGVGELEAMLKEREAEILTLRQVMDRNERAIFQVSWVSFLFFFCIFHFFFFFKLLFRTFCLWWFRHGLLCVCR